MKELLDKYFKPKSLTWWAAVAPLLAGVVLLVASATPLAAEVRALYGANADAWTLINIGLAGIGLRGAITPAKPSA